jgi:hypothetical protein
MTTIAAVHFENFVFVLLVIGFYLFQALLSAAAKTKKRDRTKSTSTTRPPPSLRRTDSESDQERIRKFLEALGQPTTNKPPPPVAPRPTYQRPIVVPKREAQFGKRSILSPLPPLTTRPPDLPESSPPPLVVAQRERSVVGPKADLPAFEIHETARPITEAEVKGAFAQTAVSARSKSSDKTIEIAGLLRSTSGLREAIILREIFGPPRSMQPVDLVGTV